MKSRHGIILILLLFLGSSAAIGQSDCTTDPPLAPVLVSVSVQYETGRTKLTWTPSPSANIAAYIVYSFKSGDGMPIDTIHDPLSTGTILNTTVSKYFSVSYVVSAMRLPRCTSTFSNPVNSIFCEASLDTCNKKIQVSWNLYSSLKQNVTGYTVLSSADGINYSEIAVAGPSETKFTYSKFDVNANYCFVVRANIDDGSYSSSNKACLSTIMQRPPDWINADYATVNADNKIALKYSIDPLSEIIHFSLERKNRLSGSSKIIALPVSSNGSVSFTDEKAGVDSVYQYRLSAINSCGLPVIVSNPATNIVVSLKRENNDINIKWNQYGLWTGINEGYRIFADLGSGFGERAFISATDTSYILKYSELMYYVTGNTVCLYVSATETSNPFGINGSSRSQTICTEPSELVTVPNLFTPDNDLINDLFRPVLSFTPAEYHLVISDRHGNVLFESSDCNESWDGTSSGKPFPQGVCLWHLITKTPSGKEIKKTGTITIIRGN